MYGWRMRQSVTFVTTMKNNSGEPSIYRGSAWIKVILFFNYLIISQPPPSSHPPKRHNQTGIHIHLFLFRYTITKQKHSF